MSDIVDGVRNTVEVFMNVPEPHPAKEFCEKHGYTVAQVARKILRSEEEARMILDGKAKPNAAVEERLQHFMRTYG